MNVLLFVSCQFNPNRAELQTIGRIIDCNGLGCREHWIPDPFAQEMGGIVMLTRCWPKCGRLKHK